MAKNIRVVRSVPTNPEPPSEKTIGVQHPVYGDFAGQGDVRSSWGVRAALPKRGGATGKELLGAADAGDKQHPTTKITDISPTKSPLHRKDGGLGPDADNTLDGYTEY